MKTIYLLFLTSFSIFLSCDSKDLKISKYNPYREGDSLVFKYVMYGKPIDTLTKKIGVINEGESVSSFYTPYKQFFISVHDENNINVLSIWDINSNVSFEPNISFTKFKVYEKTIYAIDSTYEERNDLLFFDSKEGDDYYSHRPDYVSKVLWSKKNGFLVLQKKDSSYLELIHLYRGGKDIFFRE